MTRSKEPRARRQKENPRRESGLGVIFSLSLNPDLAALWCKLLYYQPGPAAPAQTDADRGRGGGGQEIRLSQAKLVQKLRNKDLVL